MLYFLIFLEEVVKEEVDALGDGGVDIFGGDSSSDDDDSSNSSSEEEESDWGSFYSSCILILKELISHIFNLIFFFK